MRLAIARRRKTYTQHCQNLDLMHAQRQETCERVGPTPCMCYRQFRFYPNMYIVVRNMHIGENFRQYSFRF
jgi:hypothetical protein